MRRYLPVLLVLVGVSWSVLSVLDDHAEAQSASSGNERWLPRDDECQNLNPYWTLCKGRVPDRSLEFNAIPGYVLMGRPGVWEGAPDFFLNAEN